MDLQNRKELKETARQRLTGAQDAVKIALIYASIIVGASLLVNGVRFFLDSQISQFGGLRNMGLRSVLSTIQTMMPIVLQFLLMALALGFTGSMLRIGRGQYASPMSMKIGFDRFWVLLRATLLQGGLYALALLAAYIISMQVFFLTPMSRGLISAMAPMLKDTTGDVMELLANPAVLDQMMTAMIPLYLLMGAIFLAVAAPIHYRYILVKYLIIDEPGNGALAMMRESRMLMRRKAMSFFKLDLSLWVYYAANIVAMLVCYGVSILSLCGVALPGNVMALSLICFAVYLVLTFLITLFLQPHMEVTHALAYECLKPRQQASGGAVLGNIFDLAREQMQNFDM